MQATLTQSILRGADQTAAEMETLVRKFSSDIGPKKDWTLSKFFDYVKNLEFRPDPQGHESISRPALSMLQNWPWRDCDDKSILIGSFCFENGIPFKFRASSKRPDKKLHHVFVIAKIDGRECVLDATYPKNKLGIPEKGATHSINLSGDIMNPTLSVFSGDETLGNPFSNLGRKVKNVAKKPVKAAKKVVKVSRAVKAVAHKVLSVPGVRDAVKSTGIGAIVLAAAKKAESYKFPSGLNPTPAAAPLAIIPEETTRPKWMVPAAIGAGALVLILATRKGSK